MFKMGARIINKDEGRVEFRIFAYDKKEVCVIIKTGAGVEEFPMQEEQPHLYSITVEGLGIELLYKFKLDGEEYPDPYSNFQPSGVHGFSQLIDHESYRWQDSQWKGLDPEELIIMEIHVGTFTEAGTFSAIVDKLDYLLELGINAIELMPVAQTPGKWNWGYDGANLFSVNHNYGTPDDLKNLIDHCHQKNIAVILDVVYNHFGPEGNYLHAYGPYFTHKHETPWGAALNYDDRYREYTREMVLNNVGYWLKLYRFDGLRLDAVHTIVDSSPIHILQEISLLVKNLSIKHGRKMFVTAESDGNNVRLINPLDEGGYGIDAQWMDDFHHCIHTALTGEQEGYYIDYGPIEDFSKVYKNYLYTGEYSKCWDKPRGTDGSQNPGKQFVVCIQNHDQVGNRAKGDRLSTLVEFPYLKAAAGLLLFSAYVPLLFMGEEYGEQRPFLFFTDYQDPGLQKAVSEGRREEFKNFTWEDVPDPQAEETFYSSKLTPKRDWSDKNYMLFCFYKDLIRMRKNHPVLKTLDKFNLDVSVDSENQVVKIARWNEQKMLVALVNLGDADVELDDYPGTEMINSEWSRYGGSEETLSGTLRKGQFVIFETGLGVP